MHTIMQTENCKGCHVPYSIGCGVKYDSEMTKRCPCLNCVIKVLCSKVCHERESLGIAYNNKVTGVLREGR